MASYKKLLLDALVNAGWEQVTIVTRDLEWWADELWLIRSVREHWGFELWLTFAIDPSWEPWHRPKVQPPITCICARPRAPTTSMDAVTGTCLWMGKGRFDAGLRTFIAKLERSRSLASMSAIERLAWDVMSARCRGPREQEAVGHYVLQLMEPTFGVPLAVGRTEDRDGDVIRAPVVERAAKSHKGPVWMGFVAGNLVGHEEAVAYSTILFPFERVGKTFRRRQNDELQSVSAMCWDGRIDVYASGDFDVYGEWDDTREPADLYFPEELSADVVETLSKLEVPIPAEWGGPST